MADTATANRVALEFETVIGLEVHSQVLTKSKMYCACSAEYAGAEPNTHTCPVCLGLPGSLPVLNQAALELVMLTGVALGCEIPEYNKLDRKNYFYPDLPKGYQISQYDLPLCVNGELVFEVNGEEVRCGITRVHMEEDTGRLVHRVDALGREVSLVDLNRSGVPLMEIVGEPDLRSPEAAHAFLVALRQMLRYIGASTGNMEEGAFRCDANISTRTTDGTLVGAKVEVKNMNSFRAVERALKYEEQRQRAELAAGRLVPQETRGWDDARGITVGQRTKEEANDYRYFPEPDVPSLRVTRELVQEVATRLPELPPERRARFEREYRLRPADAALLTAEREIADYFERVVGGAGPERARQAANWILNDLMGLQGTLGLPAERLPISAEQLSDLLEALEAEELTARAAKELLPQIREGELPRDAARRLNLLSLTDTEAVERAAREAIAANPAVVADYRSGKQAAIGRLIGETMKRTGGRAKPDQVRATLLTLLDA